MGLASDRCVVLLGLLSFLLSTTCCAKATYYSDKGQHRNESSLQRQETNDEKYDQQRLNNSSSNDDLERHSWMQQYTPEWWIGHYQDEMPSFQNHHHHHNNGRRRRLILGPGSVRIDFSLFWAFYYHVEECENAIPLYPQIDLQCASSLAQIEFVGSTSSNNSNNHQNNETMVECHAIGESSSQLHCIHKDPSFLDEKNHTTLTYACHYPSVEALDTSTAMSSVWLDQIQMDESIATTVSSCSTELEGQVLPTQLPNNNNNSNNNVVNQITYYATSLLMIRPRCMTASAQAATNAQLEEEASTAQRCFCIHGQRCGGACVYTAAAATTTAAGSNVNNNNNNRRRLQQQDETPSALSTTLPTELSRVGVYSLPVPRNCVVTNTPPPITSAPVTPSPVATPFPTPTPVALSTTTPAPVRRPPPTPRPTTSAPKPTPAPVSTTRAPITTPVPIITPSPTTASPTTLSPVTPAPVQPMPNIPAGPYVTQETATERVTLPHPPPQDLSLVNRQTDCPHHDTSLLEWHVPDTLEHTPWQDLVLPENSRMLISRTIPLQIGLLNIPVSSELVIGESADGSPIDINVRGIFVAGNLTIGSETCRIQDTKITITLHGSRPANAVTNVPGTTYKGISVLGGTLHMHGKRYYRTWTRLSRTVDSGNTLLLLQNRVNWESGQEIVLVTTAMKDSREFHQNEVLVIDSVFLPPTDHEVGALVYVTTPVQHTHLANSNYQAEVGLLSRKILIQGSPTDSEATDPDPLNCRSSRNDWYGDRSIPCPNKELTGFGGHVMIWGGGRGYVSGVELFRMGQTNVLARYPMHFHVLGDHCSDCYFVDSSIHRSYYRCVSVHGTNHLLVSENVAYDAIGFCYYLEDGVEENNVLSFNLAAHIHMIAGGPDQDPPTASGNTTPLYRQNEALTLPADIAAAGFYITNIHNRVIGNVASGGWTGFAFPSLPGAIGPHRTRNVRPMNVLGLEIDGNTAHSTAWWWHRAGAFYFGGTLLYDEDDPSRLVYNPGRDRSFKRNTCLEDRCETRGNCNDGCPEHLKAWVEVSNSKVFLTPGAGLNAWNGRMDILTYESHDMGLSIEGLQDGFAIDNMLAVCRTGDPMVLPPGARANKMRGQGFFWYDTNQEHIITRTTFRNCGYRSSLYDQYNDDPTRGCGNDAATGCDDDSFVFGFRAHSDQHNPELMQATEAIRFENCGRRFNLHDYRGTNLPSTVSGRLQNWFDVDGSVTGFGEPSIIGSGLSDAGLWWAADQDGKLSHHSMISFLSHIHKLTITILVCVCFAAVYDPQGPLYFLKQRAGPERGMGHIKLSFDRPLQSQVPSNLCNNGGGNPCYPVGYIRHLGPMFANDQGLPVTANADIVGPVGGFGWLLEFNEGAPRTLRIQHVELKPETPLMLSLVYPLGTNVTVTASASSCRSNSRYSCSEQFHRVGTTMAVRTSLGNAYHMDDATGVLTIRVIETPRNFVGVPEWFLPTFEDEGKYGVGFALPRFERRGILLPKANKGAQIDIRANCARSESNNAYCAIRPTTTTTLLDNGVCPSGYSQTAYDKCCSSTQCVYANGETTTVV